MSFYKIENDLDRLVTILAKKFKFLLSNLKKIIMKVNLCTDNAKVIKIYYK